ncbi:phospho-N-acetylmuramoyl-pentapeptide-transferase [Oscillatoria sp. FACHB-1407]|uniref:phospho-N-acetylmuramoyl-pentapeptide- transferase n=1 Tax=Oscillatoria sp. FACHB-1407 TaxID=2692847 RepID=UPI001684F94E|nr:phospho-N-acetylmuramoyl-pentapeptide-transferase [Oscillatoria sp. FACHB-1407]MBD2465003.1 phospho-N-acetylmuramoyl-pentapeptide-transferase [Oscillatoria sp. FACHB-1407]
MDAKLSPNEQIGLSGRVLSIILGTVLLGIAPLLDMLAGRTPWGVALTLPLWVSAIATALLGFWVVPQLRRLKMGQFIREDGPQAHLKKAGTPTMGGLFVVPTGVAIALLWSGFTPNVVAVAALTLAYGFIGWLDDWQILRRKSNKGISPRLKLMLQIGFGALFCLWAMWSGQSTNITGLALPLGLTLPLGFLFYPLAWFVLVAESNATNLTDGLDGLAGGTGAIALFGLAVLVSPTSPDLMVFCACMAGSFLGFLVHNHNPARVFMGDTGALAMGGALAAVAILTQNLLGLLILSGIFFAETLSVIAQVSYYKATKDSNGVGKRLFKMAPLHHHLELTGWSEIQVVARFYLVGGLLALICIALYL